MKQLRHILALLLWLGLGGVVLVGFAAALFIARPQAFLPKNSLPLASRIAGMFGVHLNFPKETTLRIESVSLLKKRAVLEGPSLCYDSVAPHVSGCFGYVHAEAEIQLGLAPKLTKLGPIEAREGRFRVQLTAESDPKEEKPSEPSAGGLLPKGVEIGPVAAEFKALRIEAPTWELVTSLAVGSEPTYHLVANGKMKLEGGERPFSIGMRGEGDEREAKGKIDGWVERPVKELKRVTLDTCGFEVKNLLMDNMQWHLLCPTEVVPAQKVIPKDWTEGWDGKVRLLVRAEGGTEGSQDPKGNVEIDLLPFKTAVVHGQGKVQFHLEDLLKQKLAAVVETDIHVVDFRRAVNIVEDKPYAVPSPLNDLRGELSLTTNGQAEIDFQNGSIPFTLETKLGSDPQRFVTRTEGALGFKANGKTTDINLAADIALQNVELVLPPLEPRKIPRLFPDPRIRFPERQVAQTKSNFHYTLRIHTPPSSPVRLVSNLAKAPVPVHVNLNLSSEKPVSGSLRVAAFPVEVLRRKATVRYFRLEIAEGMTSPPIDGEIEVSYAEYQLAIRVKGTTELPHLTIESDPPLTEEDAYSVLVFGRPLSELSPTDGDTVANLRAAVSNRAVGLASMYLLATTPIESVTYDPTSNVFSARIRIADGTSLNVGSDWKSVTQLGVKRKLSPSWILNTFIDNPFGGTTQQQRSVSSFLEWSKRY